MASTRILAAKSDSQSQMPVPRIKRAASIWSRFEDTLSLLSLFSLALLSFTEIVSVSLFKYSVPHAAPLASHLTLLFACFASVIAGREGKQLGLGAALPDRGLFPWLARSLAALLKTTFLILLAITAISMVLVSFDYSKKIGFIPLWVFTACIPFAFLVLAARSIRGTIVRFPLSTIIGFLVAIWLAVPSLAGIASIVFI